jgi:hypothetical protein
MRNSWLHLALLVPAAALAQTTTGPLPADNGLLRIVADGAVVVRGEERSDLGYMVRNRAATREEISRMEMKSVREGEWTTIKLPVPVSEIRVPRALRRIRVEGRGDSVEVYDLSGQVEVASGGAKIRIDRVAGDVAVRTGGGQVWLGTLGGSVRCFSGGGRITAGSIAGEAELATQGGEIAIGQVAGPLRASSGGGGIKVERAGQGATLTTAGGSIEVGQAGGPVVAQSAAGAIQVRSSANVRCNSGNGAIRLSAVSGQLRASTALGGIVADLAAGGTIRDSEIAAVLGDITVFIPSNLAVTVQATNTGSAASRIVSDFPEIQPRPAYGARMEAGGTVNGGGPVLKLSTSGGTIYLRRR